MSALATNLRHAVRQPHVVGLCEIFTQSLAQQVIAQAGLSSFDVLFRPAPLGTRLETGIAIAYDRNVLRVVPGSETTDLDLAPASRRPRWFAVLFENLTGNGGALWVVANHWKSQRGGQFATDPDRQASAFSLGEFYTRTARLSSESMLLIGDFNCEPGDRPFYTQAQRLLRGQAIPNGIKCLRERALVLRDKNRLPYFYNLMWNHMAEPLTLTQSRLQGAAGSRMLGTHGPATIAHGSTGWLMFDQVLVSKRLLAGGAMRVVEDSVAIHPPQLADFVDHAAVSVELDA